MWGRSSRRPSRFCWSGCASRSLQRLRHRGPLQPHRRRTTIHHVTSRLRSGAPSGNVTWAAAPTSPKAAGAAIRTSSWNSTTRTAGRARERTRSRRLLCAVVHTTNFERDRILGRNTWGGFGERDSNPVHRKRRRFSHSRPALQPQRPQFEGGYGRAESRGVLLWLVHEPGSARRGEPRARRLGTGLAARLRRPDPRTRRALGFPAWYLARLGSFRP